MYFRCLPSSVRMSIEKPDPSSFSAVLVVATWNWGCSRRLVFHTHSYLPTCEDYAYICICSCVCFRNLFHFSSISVFLLTHSFPPFLFPFDVKPSILLQMLFSMSWSWQQQVNFCIISFFNTLHFSPTLFILSCYLTSGCFSVLIVHISQEKKINLTSSNSYVWHDFSCTVSVHFLPSTWASLTKQFWTLHKPTATSLNKALCTILACFNHWCI